MNSKGVSPMIAVVLLIAFTITVGGIMSVWLSGYASTTQEAVENASTDQVKCTGTYIDVISVDSNAILITNRGAESISSINCYSANGTQWAVGTLSAGALNKTGWQETEQDNHTVSYVSDFGTLVACTGKCLSIGVTGECKSGQGCWKI